VPYPRQPKQEDVNVESRTQSSVPVAPVAPYAPQVTDATGGAPRTSREPPVSTETRWFTPANKPAPWANTVVPPPTTRTDVPRSDWTLGGITQAEPEFVNEFKNLLWEKYLATPENQRNGLFWQGIKQNPEAASASFVRRMLENMKATNAWINGEQPPTMTQAMQTTLANNEMRQWLRWVRSGGKQPRVGA